MNHERSAKVVAVAAEDDVGIEGQVSAYFGRCPFYVVAEVEGIHVKTVRVVPNPNFARHQPGAMPRFIYGLGAHAILAGGMGPRAIDMFRRVGIEVVTDVSGKIRDALSVFLSGNFGDAAPCKHDGRHGCSSHDQQPQSTVAFTVCGSAHGLNGELDPRFGRAERFVLVDVEQESVLEEFENPVIDQAHGVGSAASALVAGRGANAVVGNRFGPNAVDALEALGVKAFEAPNGITVGEALQRLRTGRLGQPVVAGQGASR